MRKIVAWALITTIVIVLSLCACSNSSQSQQNTTTEEATTVASAVEATTEEIVTETETETETEPEPEFVTETAHCKLESICLDSGYKDKNSDSIKMVYVFYTIHTDDKNLKVSSKACKLVMNDSNEYSSEYFSAAGTYIKSYYYSEYIEDVYMGDELKTLATFKVPEAEFKDGRKLAFYPYGCPEEEIIIIATDDVERFDSCEELAKKADPEGYQNFLDLHEPADEETIAKVREHINWYEWSFFVNNLSYSLEFMEPNNFEINCTGLSNGGTYSVLKGYVVLEYPNGKTVDIPYTWKENGDIDLDVVSAFDIHSN